MIHKIGKFNMRNHKSGSLADCKTIDHMNNSHNFMIFMASRNYGFSDLINNQLLTLVGLISIFTTSDFGLHGTEHISGLLAYCF